MFLKLNGGCCEDDEYFLKHDETLQFYCFIFSLSKTLKIGDAEGDGN